MISPVSRRLQSNGSKIVEFKLASNTSNAVFDRKNPGFRIQDSEYNGKGILVLFTAMTQRADFLALKQLVFLEVVVE